MERPYKCICGHTDLRHAGDKGLGPCQDCSCDEQWDDEESWTRRCKALEANDG